MTCCSATEQMRLKAPHKHCLENLHLPPLSHQNALMSPGAWVWHFIRFVADILMLFKVTPGRPNAVCSPAKQKFSSVADWFCFSSHGGVDFVRERWQEKALETDFSLKKVLWEKWKWWQILVSGHARLVGGFFCRSCGTRWLEPQSAWTAVAARSKLQWWLNSLGRVTKAG